jgi:glycerol-3-phosphate dehydrogenase (NAD(P)+)
MSDELGAPAVGIIGGGPWGLALARAAARGGGRVSLYTRREQDVSRSTIEPTTDLAIVARAKLLVLAVPTPAVRDVARALGEHIDGSHLVVHGIRGLSDGLETVSDILREETPARRLGALGGPVQATELTEGRPSAMVCGSHYPEVCKAVSTAFSGEWLRVYATHDLRGVEWASAMVGALAIGVGFAEAAGAGPGLLAALIVRAMDDAARLAVASGAEERTLLGLAGYGDLLASIGLRNRPEVVIGHALARGASIDEAVVEAKLRVEGIGLVPRIVDFARKRQVPAPSFEAILSVFEGSKADVVLGKLLSA